MLTGTKHIIALKTPTESNKILGAIVNIAEGIEKIFPLIKDILALKTPTESAKKKKIVYIAESLKQMLNSTKDIIALKTPTESNKSVVAIVNIAENGKHLFAITKEEVLAPKKTLKTKKLLQTIKFAKKTLNPSIPRLLIPPLILLKKIS